ncbi:hypothetical protein [Sphingomonas pruni]|uniref:hypothetical protein n=1 Tax=Sphingomonas pruni TaxID=40683 RepID=UPI000AF64690|nr:hypothetical protein [Sphingomonas pruni]
MATVADAQFGERRDDHPSGMPRANSVDRWIFVGMALWFIAIVLVGFVPDSMMKVAMIKAGARAPFPFILHVHAVLMGSFLLLLLSQTVMVATGRGALHKQVGIAAYMLVPALIGVGFLLAPTMYYQVWGGAKFGPPNVRSALAPIVPIVENILLLQISAGVLFGIFMTIALKARATNAGLHKRMIFLATAVPLGAAIDRMSWLPSSMPGSPWASYVYVLASLAPLFVWDLVRHRRVHQAYWVFLAFYIPATTLVVMAWDKPWWHATAHRIMRV